MPALPGAVQGERTDDRPYLQAACLYVLIFASVFAVIVVTYTFVPHAMSDDGTPTKDTSLGLPAPLPDPMSATAAKSAALPLSDEKTIWQYYAKLESEQPAARAEVESALSAPTCDPEEEFERFKADGGVTHTRCPVSDEWLNGFAAVDPDPDKVILVVGCNKGVDAVDLFSQYDNRKQPFSVDKWIDNFPAEFTANKAGACGQVSTPEKLVRSTAKVFPRIHPQVHCVEPMPSNIKLLRQTANASQLPRAGFHIYQAAIGASDDPHSVMFNDFPMGTEYVGIHAKRQQNAVEVAHTSVDALFGHLPRVDMLLVDTEGNDPLALLGSPRTLQKARYVEFENHDVGEWGSYKLRTVISYVDNLGFDCYWMSSSGKLFRITQCWHKKYASRGFKTWSNIGCARRKDAWWGVMHKIWSKQLQDYNASVQVAK